MFGRSVGIVAASALGATAFLIPANVASLSKGPSADLTPVALNAKQQVLQLPCPECAFSKPQQERIQDLEELEDGEQEFRIQGGANSIVVNLTISEDGQKLQVNGETIYPLGLESILAQRIYVKQVASSASIEDIESGKARATPLEVTGSGVSVHEEEVVSEEGHKLVTVKHSIFELERQPVTLDEVNIKLLTTVNGELFLAHVTSEGQRPTHPEFPDFFAPPKWAQDMEKEMSKDMKEMEDEFMSILPHPHPHGPADHAGEQKECRHLPATLCKMRIMLEDQLKSMRKGAFKKLGCHGRKGKGFAHIRPHFLRIGQDGEGHHGRPHHMRPHGHHHHHKHHFMHSFARGVVAVLVPTMAGLAVGMIVSLVGLFIGRLISFLWIHFYRGGRRGYQSVSLDDEEEIVEEEDDMEKKSYVVLEQSEPLPVYEEAPAYEEIEKEEK
ncbi:hypothetical protein CB0940_07981 [Cercospora beticola]|uniref:DUF7728 domain-containing protein n=1 Tax=Cercospora beticola TaxID=122368 RepID=A0A2G5HQ05_CERBT|nr:hypothetical protein CB0940_07981 [Cercospora beticola]PIA94610.1 hypothetical protein CB0940_07981 [Cercospora beticola]WPB04533.1 hypothetical protein RHO25_009179 [Cercospora beticola]